MTTEERLSVLEKHLEALKSWTFAHDVYWEEIVEYSENPPEEEEEACFRLVPVKENECPD
jgi:hypothetical protein